MITDKHENKVELIGTYGGDLTHATEVVSKRYVCSRCKSPKRADDMCRDRSKQGGFARYCRPCQTQRSREWQKANPERARANAKKHLAKPETKAKRALMAKMWSRKSVKSTLLTKARGRANKECLPFNLIKEDITIPDTCPALGIPISVSDGEYGAGSPTLDRIIPKNGYVKGNVAVISHRANAIKSDASLAELEAITRYVRESLSR